MVITDAETVFLDTNILVYANVAESPFHEDALAAIVTRYAANVELWISRQVIREYVAVMSRPNISSSPKPAGLLTERISFFQSNFSVAEDNYQVTHHLMMLIEQIPVGGRQIHDANIVATMQAYNIPKLLTHNIKDFERYADLIEILPIVET